MGKVAGIPGGLDFIRDFEGKAFPPLAPGRCIARVVPIEQKRGGQCLQERREMHSGCCLADTAFIAGDGDNHATSLCIFGRIKMWTYKNTKIGRGMQGLFLCGSALRILQNTDSRRTSNERTHNDVVSVGGGGSQTVVLLVYYHWLGNWWCPYNVRWVQKHPCFSMFSRGFTRYRDTAKYC